MHHNQQLIPTELLLKILSLTNPAVPLPKYVVAKTPAEPDPSLNAMPKQLENVLLAMVATAPPPNSTP